MDMGGRTHPPYHLQTSPSPFLGIDNFSHSARMELQMFKPRWPEGSSFPYLFFLEDVDKHEFLPLPWWISSAKITLCAHSVGMGEMRVFTYSWTDDNRDQPPSTRLMCAQVSVPHTCGFSFQLPIFLDVLSMCLTAEGKEWALVVLFATGGFHYGKKQAELQACVAQHRAAGLLESPIQPS